MLLLFALAACQGSKIEVADTGVDGLSDDTDDTDSGTTDSGDSGVPDSGDSGGDTGDTGTDTDTSPVCGGFLNWEEIFPGEIDADYRSDGTDYYTYLLVGCGEVVDYACVDPVATFEVMSIAWETDTFHPDQFEELLRLTFHPMSDQTRTGVDCTVSVMTDLGQIDYAVTVNSQGA